MKQKEYVKRGGASKIIGCDPKTLIRWERQGKFVPFYHDPDGHRTYRVIDCLKRKKEWEKEGK